MQLDGSGNFLVKASLRQILCGDAPVHALTPFPVVGPALVAKAGVIQTLNWRGLRKQMGSVEGRKPLKSKEKQRFNAGSHEFDLPGKTPLLAYHASAKYL